MLESSLAVSQNVQHRVTIWPSNSTCRYKVQVKFTLSCPTLCDPVGYIVYGILQARILEQIAFRFSRGSSQPRDGTQVSRIADSLPAEIPEKPKNTGVGSLSLLQQIFPTQELNLGLLHYRRILYQLSYQGRYKEK